MAGIKNELLHIREYFHPLLKGEIYLPGEQVCEMFHISKRTLQQSRDDGLIPFIKLGQKILFRESDIMKVLERNYNGYNLLLPIIAFTAFYLITKNHKTAVNLFFTIVLHIFNL